jgi:hypothetical protein
MKHVFYGSVFKSVAFVHTEAAEEIRIANWFQIFRSKQ